MLILSRKPGESIIIDGRITVKIMRLEGDVVKVGIEAPIHVPVHRHEVVRGDSKEQSGGPGPDRDQIAVLERQGQTDFPQGGRGQKPITPCKSTLISHRTLWH